ncbi:hypothetical protein ACLOJK_012382 [Asimina triloba]
MQELLRLLQIEWFDQHLSRLDLFPSFSSVSDQCLWARRISVDDYQELLDRGWRRSGSFLYKPVMERTCCPSYTIRLKASNFVPSKEQIRVSRRMQRLDLADEELNGSATLWSSSGDASAARNSESTANASCLWKCQENKLEEYINHLSNEIDRAVTVCVERGELPSSVQFPRATVKKVIQRAKKRRVESSGELLYTSSISFQIAAALRRLKSVENTVQQSGFSCNGATQDDQPSELSPQIVAEKLACSLDKLVKLPSLWIKACNGHLNFYTSKAEIASREGPVAANASTQSSKGSGANAEHNRQLNKSAPPPKMRKLEKRLKRSSFDEEEYALYRKYQITVHNDEPNQVTESSYKRFLVDTPLAFIPPSDDGTVPHCGFGSFHQQYLIDGRLVAVGVVDILPRCLSSKYLFWDPDLAFLSLGKYSALQEINWVREAEVQCPSLQYYYLGYYIHSCSKMKYKAAYCPSELLCPLRYQWVPFNVVRPLLDKKPYVILSDYKILQKRLSSLALPENSVGDQPSPELAQEGLNETLSDEDEDMEPDFEVSDSRLDHEPFQETSNVAPAVRLEADDVGNIMIDLHGVILKFKNLRRAFRPGEGNHVDLLEKQLREYLRAVGPELAGRLVYSLG